ncbi:MAG: lipid-binding SYLF domain-containing protein [Desulfomonile sp.]|nr:lipid-binding SYLF domain-containing protein [Desulfomonile sp.]
MPEHRRIMQIGSAITFTLLAAALLFPRGASALTVEDVDKRIQGCRLVLSNVLTMPDKGVPRDLLVRCRGLAVFPGVIKAGVVVGVSFGNGVVLRRDQTSGLWSKPVFFNIRGGSIGLQAGAQSTDLILLIMSEEGFERLLEEKLTLGADVSVAAGPVGREASAETSIRLNAGILSYSRAKGLFAGFSLKGAALEPDTEANEVYHGKDISVQDVLYENKGALSEAARSLVEVLDQTTK